MFDLMPLCLPLFSLTPNRGRTQTPHLRNEVVHPTSKLDPLPPFRVRSPLSSCVFTPLLHPSPFSPFPSQSHGQLLSPFYGGVPFAFLFLVVYASDVSVFRGDGWALFVVCFGWFLAFFFLHRLTTQLLLFSFPPSSVLFVLFLPSILSTSCFHF